MNLDRAYDSIDALRLVADARGVSVAQVALAWLLHQKVVTSVIIGAKRVDQLEDNLAATGIKLTQDELAALDQVSALPPEYPGWMHVRQGEYRRKQLGESGAA
ncbi:L-glyceraldehyde 3-phosphate reductase [compost metagenome]